MTSTGTLGRGPGEIVRYGSIIAGIEDGSFWMPDYGKLVMWKFSIDSIINNETYKPEKLFDFDNEFFLIRFDLLNDGIALGKAAEVTSTSTYNEYMAKLNFYSGKLEHYGYKHPNTPGKKSRSLFKLSVENNIYILGHVFSDLLTICDLEGNLKYNIYGPDWLKNKDNKKSYFGKVNLIGNHIIVAYNGDDDWDINEFERPEANGNSKFLIFDLDGNYKKPLKWGSDFTRIVWMKKTRGL